MKFVDLEKQEVKEEEPKKNKHSVKHSKENALEKHEQEELIRVIKSLDMQEKFKFKYEVLIHLLMNAGLRISEAIQCRLSWFNETEDGVTINIPLKDRDLLNMKRDWKPKTLKGQREVIFIDKAVGQKVRSFFVNNERGFQFTRQRGYQVIKAFGKQMGKPDLHPHALRSTYANSLVYAGVTEATLCYFMGWANLETARNYVKTSKIAARKDLLEKFGITNN